MITFENGFDSRVWEQTAPCVARYYTGRRGYKFVVIGTTYGYWHTTGGDARFWETASGARRALKRYIAAKETTHG